MNSGVIIIYSTSDTIGGLHCGGGDIDEIASTVAKGFATIHVDSGSARHLSSSPRRRRDARNGHQATMVYRLRSGATGRGTLESRGIGAHRAVLASAPETDGCAERRSDDSFRPAEQGDARRRRAGRPARSTSASGPGWAPSPAARPADSSRRAPGLIRFPVEQCVIVTPSGSEGSLAFVAPGQRFLAAARNDNGGESSSLQPESV